ncbi:hypothetical protein VTK73DRAFT_141 [Phialemonium thermophilum]|uniref:Uncharacterized protein n=1 Tax=Phialemonium thermophilum TaxID=223376 RepID=A0ABR3XFS2_9PEZI
MRSPTLGNWRICYFRTISRSRRLIWPGEVGEKLVPSAKESSEGRDSHDTVGAGKERPELRGGLSGYVRDKRVGWERNCRQLSINVRQFGSGVGIFLGCPRLSPECTVQQRFYRLTTCCEICRRGRRQKDPPWVVAPRTVAGQLERHLCSGNPYLAKD